jgi:hypothetical protein
VSKAAQVWLPSAPMNPRLRCLGILHRCAHNGLVGGSSPPGPTTQSYATGDFLKVYKRPRIGGDLCDRSFSETASLPSAGGFCAYFSGPEIPFPGNGDRERQRLGSNAGYAEGPFDFQPCLVRDGG